MLSNEQEHVNNDGITHSPYYGCTTRVISKANVSYEGILDGISKGKDRLYLKNVRVNGNSTSDKSELKGNDDNDGDDLNIVMINHLVNDIHIYDEVCLNVRDIKELNLLQLPTTFHQAKEKLRSIDPCLLDIRLSSMEQSEPIKQIPTLGPIARRPRTESNTSLGSTAMGFSSSNESSSSLPESIRVPQRTSADTLLAKKVLPKRTERRSDYRSSRMQSRKVSSTLVQQRKLSPIRISIASKLNPNAAPFYVQHRTLQSLNSSPTETPFRNRNQTVRRSTASLGSIGNYSHRTTRTYSGTSSNSSTSVEIVSQTASNSVNDEQYDFEKANKEFRRYLELEELVTRASLSSSTSIDDASPVSSSYKKEVSFFDRISCTATTGTAVAYTEVDELEKNRETFGDDALLLLSSNDGNTSWRF